MKKSYEKFRPDITLVALGISMIAVWMGSNLSDVLGGLRSATSDRVNDIETLTPSLGAATGTAGIILRAWMHPRPKMVAWADLPGWQRVRRAAWIVAGLAFSLLWCLDPFFVLLTTISVAGMFAPVIAPIFDQTLGPLLAPAWAWFGVLCFWAIPGWAGWALGEGPWVGEAREASD